MRWFFFAIHQGIDHYLENSDIVRQWKQEIIISRSHNVGIPPGEVRKSNWEKLSDFSKNINPDNDPAVVSKDDQEGSKDRTDFELRYGASATEMYITVLELISSIILQLSRLSVAVFAILLILFCCLSCNSNIRYYL